MFMLFFRVCETSTFFSFLQRLAGATLLVFANKQDLPGAMGADEIRTVRI